MATCRAAGRAVVLAMKASASSTRLADSATIPKLCKIVASKKIDPTQLVTHHFTLDQIVETYDTFGDAAKTKALKLIISTSPARSLPPRDRRAAARGDIATVILGFAGVCEDGCKSPPLAHQVPRITERQLDSHLYAGSPSPATAYVHMDDVGQRAAMGWVMCPQASL
jgi:hypothetical protein